MDRFGEVPVSVTNLLRIALIRVQAHRLYITEVKGRGGELKLIMRPDARIRAQNIPVLLQRYGKQLSFTAKGVPYFLCRYRKGGVAEKDAELLISLTEKLLADMKEILSEEM